MIEAGDLPGVNLSFSPAPDAGRPDKGRSLDHIGFDVTNLEEFVTGPRSARGSRSTRRSGRCPTRKVKVAFLTDPWGTYIELTEGLAP